MKSDLLRFQLEAARKQAAYAERRALHTDRMLKEFAAWQKEVTRVRRQLLSLLNHRAGLSAVLCWTLHTTCPTTEPISSYCECQIAAGTQINHLIMPRDVTEPGHVLEEPLPVPPVPPIPPKQ